MLSIQTLIVVFIASIVAGGIIGLFSRKPHKNNDKKEEV